LRWRAPLLKAVLLTVSDSLLFVSGSSIALFRCAGESCGERIGGTVDPALRALTSTIDGPGTYVLATDSPPAGSGLLIGNVTFTPRALSRYSAFGFNDLAIGFSLARPASIDVDIYNTAGRLIRRVARGLALVSGQNVVRWEGRTESGAFADDGLYLASIRSGDQATARPFAIVR
jgi:hypothetical protein